MPGRDLATTFSFLRPNELVWNYVVGNYLKGQKPPPFDLLFWNGDSTNLPGPFFSWYFRNTYLENNLKVPGRAQAAGMPLDLTRLRMPSYIFGSREDHIVPWVFRLCVHAGAARAAAFRPGSIRPYRGRGQSARQEAPQPTGWPTPWSSQANPCPETPNAWFAQAAEHAGSWWPDWNGLAVRPFRQAGQGARKIGQCQAPADRAGPWQVREGSGCLDTAIRGRFPSL